MVRLLPNRTLYWSSTLAQLSLALYMLASKVSITGVKQAAVLSETPGPVVCPKGHRVQVVGSPLEPSL